MAKLTFVTDFQPDRVHAGLLAVAAAWGGAGDLPLHYEADGRSGAGAWTGEAGGTRVASRITADFSNAREVVLTHHYTLRVGARSAEIRNDSLTTWLGQIDVVLDGVTEDEVAAARDALIAVLGKAAYRPPRRRRPAPPAPAPSGPLTLAGVEMMVLLGTPERLRNTLAFGIDDGVLAALAKRLVHRDKGNMVEVLLEHGLPDDLRARLAQDALAFGYAKLAERLGAAPPDALTWLRACEREPIAVLTALLDAGADAEAEAHPTSRSTSDFWRGIRRDGWTPLMVALHNDRLDLLELLLARGVDPNRPTRSYRMPLDVARTRKHRQLAAPLLAAGARAWTDADHTLPSAVWHGRDDLARDLLPDATPAQCVEAFEVAARVRKAQWVDTLMPDDPAVLRRVVRRAVADGTGGPLLLLAEAADVRGSASELLSLAISHDRGDSIRTLHRVGCDPFAPLTDGHTPMQRAIAGRHRDALRALDALGAPGPDLATTRSTWVRRMLGPPGRKMGRHADTARENLEGCFGPLTRPARRLQLVRLAADTPLDAHRFGGPVPLADREAHPRCPCGAPLDLLVQLRLDTLPDGAGAGWVQVLVCQSPHHPSARPPGQTWGVLPPTVRTRHLSPDTALSPSPTPPRIDGWTLRSTQDPVPDWPQAADSLPEEADARAHSDLVSFGFHLRGDKLGGHCSGPRGRASACPACGAPTILLAQLGHEVVVWSWDRDAHLALRQCTAAPAHLHATLHAANGDDATASPDWRRWMDALREAGDPRWQLLLDTAPRAVRAVATLYPEALLGPLATTPVDWELTWANGHWDGLTLRVAHLADATALLTRALAHPSARLLRILDVRVAPAEDDAGTPEVDDGAALLAALAVGGGPGLEDIRIVGGGGAGRAPLGGLLSRPSLRALSIHTDGLALDGIATPALERLSLRLTADGAAGIGTALAGAALPALTHLEVEVPDGPEAAAALLGELLDLPSLREVLLRCGGAPVDPLVRQLAARAAIQPPHLDQVALVGAPVSPDAIFALLDAADHLSGIGLIVLTAWSLPDRVREQAVTALPQLVLD